MHIFSEVYQACLRKNISAVDSQLMKRRLKHLQTIASFEAIAMMVGAIIGAGVLGIPYVVAQAGVAIGAFYIVFLGVIITYVHLMVAEVALRTKKRLQIPGLGRKYLGKFGGTIIGLNFVFFSYMAILAYIIASGDVLASIAPILSEFWWSMIFFSLLSLVVWKGLDGVKVAELFLAGILFLLLISLALFGLPHVDPANLLVVQYANIFVPFGVIMFAMGGVSVIPELEILLREKGKKIENTVLLGTAIPMTLYLVFSMAVVGVNGLNTTEVATIGLGQAVGPHMIILGSLFAIIAMGTSFLTIGLALRRVYEWDFKLHKLIAWGLALGVPLGLYLIGARDFIKTLGLAGALGGGLEGILFVLIFWKARKTGDVQPRGMHVSFPRITGSIVIATFALGMIVTLFL